MPFIEADKDRLYLTLNHRHNSPGYHWSLLLAPADPPPAEDDPQNLNCVCWDLANVMQDPVTGRKTSVPWYRRRRLTNQARSTTLITRVLLEKFSVSRRADTVRHISCIAERVPVYPDDSCKRWILRLLEALENAGLLRLPVPLATVGERAIKFADEVMWRVETRALKIVHTRDIPVLDARKMC
ncbi:hypothetical protein FISHEDRAFT_69863 [Fistulina hepatica ATCC 64428]|uniref:Uncharacterized protein n=1 Tax=Fistulina hepatica ATCC 64428 TaxID=1128425 RepID=A0A0D7AKP6_9AGAR|nr:hypothetical protein FISHEDRAFT_69863 [Fistulina hepatica ATCC 64428]